MDALKRLVTEEPVALQGFVQVTIALLMAYGLNWTAGQVAAVMAFSAAVLALVARALVTPTAKLD